MSFDIDISKYWKKWMKKINYLASFKHYSFEICFLKKLWCGSREKFLCDLLKLVPLCEFAPVVKSP